ncbi:protein kinase/lanthionine synthetase C family protein [Streptacidiphilus sp. PB12-B1b]|nr:protein kinase/lanthionine synthetase C family protein [Streptacidiphilus sp. PB12-B1b]
MRYEAYSYADRLFYDSPVRWSAVEEFPAAVEPLPQGWLRNPQEVWVALHPVGQALPDQGWKIHVSACLGNAEEILAVVRAYCFEHRVAFKFLRSPALVQTQNGKYAARGSSGKFMALYPVDDEVLRRCLDDLGTALEGQPGPYILSDLRWGSGPLYLRYGGFTELYCRSETGELVLALREPSGRLRPDVRRAVFEVPPWAPVPEVLAPALAGHGTDSTAAFPYTIERALHFSNGGGIYLAVPLGGEQRVILKEARPHAGLDQRGEDAVCRLGRERDILRRLRGVDAVPEELGHLTAWEHDFLVQEYIEGVPLNLWFGQRYPLVHPDTDEHTVAAYREEALRVMAAVEEGLRAIHARGVVFGDLHPRNLIVRPDGRVAFIDFELASPADEFLRPALGAAGFAAPADVTGYAVDEYALAALRLWIFLPLVPLIALDPGKAPELARAARRRFGLTTEPGAPADPASGRQPERSARLELLLDGDPASWPHLRDSLAAAITASATPERADRLFPGDPGQFTHSPLGLAYGAAGVLYALSVAGAGADPEHVQWLVDAVGRERARPGLYLGSHGVAYALDLLGRGKEALNLLDQLLDRVAEDPGSDLAGGLPGVGLTLLHFAGSTGERGLLDAATDVADRLGGGPPPTAGGRAAAGLMRGGSGAALFFLRLFERTGDTGLLDLAREALDRDLARCVVAEDGTLQVDEGARVLPYLESGSAGIGAVLHDYLAYRPEEPWRQSLEQIRRAAEPEFVVQSGLFNGRAGLIAHLAQLQDGTARHRSVIRRHIQRLTWHMVPYQGHVAFPGEQLLRLSMDLATGSAGVLLGVGAALADVPALPFWTPSPAAR